MSSLPSAALEALGAILAYPSDGYRVKVSDCRRRVAAADQEAASAVGAFDDVIANLTDSELEELYTRTFDLNPVCALEVGWHIYGEQYRRGRFMVQARDLLRRTGIEERGELPDHLMSLLPAVARLDTKDAALFAGTYLVPAVDKMRAGFEGGENAFGNVLEAVRRVLGTFAVETPPTPGPFADDDLVRIGTTRSSSTPKGAIS